MPFVAPAAAAAPQPGPHDHVDSMTLTQDLGHLLRAAQDVKSQVALLFALAGTRRAEAAQTIAPYIRSGHACLRNGAIEALKQSGEAAVGAVDALLADDAADTRLLAIEVTRAWRPALAEPRLRAILEADAALNVCAAALDVAAENGTPALLPALAMARQRFAAQPFFAFAAAAVAERLAPGGTKAA